MFKIRGLQTFSGWRKLLTPTSSFNTSLNNHTAQDVSVMNKKKKNIFFLSNIINIFMWLQNCTYIWMINIDEKCWTNGSNITTIFHYWKLRFWFYHLLLTRENLVVWTLVSPPHTTYQWEKQFCSECPLVT